ncbi:hypothetical protein AB4K20DRAFT_1918261, partial [Rhizopus microsporus]
MDKYNLEVGIAFQAVGPSLTFYALSLSHHRIYTFMELFTIEIPYKVNMLLHFLHHLDDIYFLSKLYNEKCIISMNSTIFLRAETMSFSFL